MSGNLLLTFGKLIRSNRKSPYKFYSHSHLGLKNLLVKFDTGVKLDLQIESFCPFAFFNLPLWIEFILSGQSRVTASKQFRWLYGLKFFKRSVFLLPKEKCVQIVFHRYKRYFPHWPLWQHPWLENCPNEWTIYLVEVSSGLFTCCRGQRVAVHAGK